MGCGCSSEQRELALEPSGLSTANDDLDSDDEMGAIHHDPTLKSAVSVETPAWMDKMWRVKAEQVDQSQVHTLSQAAFCKEFGMEEHKCLKVLSAFRRCCDKKEGRLQADKLRRMLAFPPDDKAHRIIARIISCFDGDSDSTMDFREFLMVAAMHMVPCSKAAMLRFWWWVMLFTDEASRMYDHGAACVSRKDATELAIDMSQTCCVPLGTVGRFFRDFLTSFHGSGVVKGMEELNYVSNPAPSKMYHKVMNLMLKNGKLKLESKLSFDAFYQLCTKDHKEFFIMVSYFFNQLARFLMGAPCPQPITTKDSERLKSYFYNKHVHYEEVERGEKRIQWARKKSGLYSDAPQTTTVTMPDSVNAAGGHEAHQHHGHHAHHKEEREGHHHKEHTGHHNEGHEHGGHERHQHHGHHAHHKEGHERQHNAHHHHKGEDHARTAAREESETSDYTSSVSDPESDGVDDSEARENVKALFSEKLAPLPKFRTYWEKRAEAQAAVTPEAVDGPQASKTAKKTQIERNKRPISRAEKTRLRETYLSKEYEAHLSFKRSQLSDELNRLDSESLGKESPPIFSGKLFRDPLEDACAPEDPRFVVQR